MTRLHALTGDDPWRDIPPPEEPPAGDPPPPRPQPIPERPDAPSAPALEFQTLADLCAEVDAAGPRRWLVRRIWPAGAYGVHAAEPKAGKTWNGLDLAVSVASGTPWLGQHPVDTTGPALVFVGEGGKGNIVRRIRAIATARGLGAEQLPIVVCARAPRLADDTHMQAMATQLDRTRPALVVLDPLYLAAGGANGADLYAMGGLLERPQHLCERVGASLYVVHHNNRQRDLTGAARMSGAGPAEWGRVLISAAVISRHTDPTTLASTVLTELAIQGGEVPDQTIRVRRYVAADDPDDLDSALEYRVDEPAPAEPIPAGPDSSLSQAAAKLLAALDAQSTPQASSVLVDHIAATHGHGLTRQTCSTELNKLRAADLADYLDPGAGRQRLWYRIRTESTAA